MRAVLCLLTFVLLFAVPAAATTDLEKFEKKIKKSAVLVGSELGERKRLCVCDTNGRIGRLEYFEQLIGAILLNARCNTLAFSVFTGEEIGLDQAFCNPFTILP